MIYGRFKLFTLVGPSEKLSLPHQSLWGLHWDTSLHQCMDGRVCRGRPQGQRGGKAVGASGRGGGQCLDVAGCDDEVYVVEKSQE